jgi:uncharacterized ferredoxin-like protein
MTLVGMVPSGAQWVHEIKHDGFRFICRRHRERLRDCRTIRCSLTALLIGIASLRSRQASFPSGRCVWNYCSQANAAKSRAQYVANLNSNYKHYDAPNH